MPGRITARAARNERIEPADRQDRIENADAAEPIENAEAAEPSDPIDSTEPTDPIDSADPLLAIDSTESSDQSDNVELCFERLIVQMLMPRRGRSYTTVRSGSRVRRCSCMSRTTVAPSPTADATRLIDPSRTSPAANTPGMLASSGSGSRSLSQFTPG